jgi:pimeloyl-ACP methyl ester carboxylesterase
MARVRVGQHGATAVELEYEAVGDGAPLVLIIGLGAQLIYWHDGFFEMLGARGFRVVRFDNRDVGLSTRLADAPVPDVRRMLLRSLLGLGLGAPYDLGHMASDTVGLFDALGIERAHVVGASMGGMIAQEIAIRFPHRVRSLTSIMSHPGGRGFMLAASPRAVRVMLAKAPRSRQEAMDRAEEFYRVVGSTGFERDVAGVRERAARAWDRAFYPPGFARQLAAVLATPSRVPALKRLGVPTLVVHGSVDPLIRPSGGRATARAVPGSELRIIDGMGHDIPRGAWPALCDAIARNAARAS